MKNMDNNDNSLEYRIEQHDIKSVKPCSTKAVFVQLQVDL